MTRTIKCIIITICIIILMWFCTLPVLRLGADKTYIESPYQNEKINTQELADFLALWQRMMNGSIKKYVAQISLKSSGQYPRPIVKWLELQNWNVERYFYIEQRLMQIVEYVNLRKNLEGNISISASGNINLGEIIADQKKKMSACPFGEDEMQLVEQNLYLITQIMSGNPVVDKKQD